MVPTESVPDECYSEFTSEHVKFDDLGEKASPVLNILRCKTILMWKSLALHQNNRQLPDVIHDLVHLFLDALGRTDFVSHDIHVGDVLPVKQHLSCMNPLRSEHLLIEVYDGEQAQHHQTVIGVHYASHAVLWYY